MLRIFYIYPDNNNDKDNIPAPNHYSTKNYKFSAAGRFIGRVLIPVLGFIGGIFLGQVLRGLVSGLIIRFFG